MIGRLTGILREKKPPRLLLEVHGVGYELEAPMSTFYELPALGESVVLHTHFVTREDAQLLYGFHTEAARQLFRAVIKISGVGPKMGLAILSGMDATEFQRCIEHGDLARLAKVPGIGKKTAERLVVELRGKLGAEAPTSLAQAPVGQVMVASSRDDAVHALIALGYKPPEAEKLVRAVYAESLTSEELIRKALQSAV